MRVGVTGKLCVKVNYRAGGGNATTLPSDRMDTRSLLEQLEGPLDGAEDDSIEQIGLFRFVCEYK